MVITEMIAFPYLEKMMNTDFAEPGYIQNTNKTFDHGLEQLQ